MGFLTSFPWATRAILMLAMVGIAYAAGIGIERARAEARLAQMTLRLERVQQQISAQTDTAYQSEQEKVRTIFKDRIVYRNREKEREIAIKQDNHCIVPQRFVSMWNSANQLYVPVTASLTDERASIVKLSDIETHNTSENPSSAIKPSDN